MASHFKTRPTVVLHDFLSQSRNALKYGKFFIECVMNISCYYCRANRFSRFSQLLKTKRRHRHLPIYETVVIAALKISQLAIRSRETASTRNVPRCSAIRRSVKSVFIQALRAQNTPTRPAASAIFDGGRLVRQFTEKKAHRKRRKKKDSRYSYRVRDRTNPFERNERGHRDSPRVAWRTCSKTHVLTSAPL